MPRQETVRRASGWPRVRNHSFVTTRSSTQDDKTESRWMNSRDLFDRFCHNRDSAPQADPAVLLQRTAVWVRVRQLSYVPLIFASNYVSPLLRI